MNAPAGDRRGLVGLLTASAISLTGTRVSVVALPWFVLVTTGSPTRTGLVAFAEMLPYVLVKALAGPLVDRLGGRRVSIAGDVAGAALVGLIPLLHLLDLLPFGVLLGAVALLGAVRGPGDSAKAVLVPAVAEAAGQPLERVTGLEDSVSRLGSTLGPGIAGLLIAVTDPLVGLAVDAATFAVAAVLITLLVPNAAQESSGGLTGYLGELREGAAFLAGDRLLRGLITMVGVTNLLDAAMVVLLPVWALSHGYGAGTVGLVFSTMSLGAIGGAVLASAVGHRLPRRLAYVVAFTVAGAPRFLVLALDSPLWAVLAVGLVAGSFAGVINPVVSAVVIERIPRRLLGRVGSLGDACAWAGIPFGGPLAAAGLAVVGLPATLLLAGCAYLGATLTPALRPWGRQMDRSPALPVGADAGAGADADVGVDVGVGVASGRPTTAPSDPVTPSVAEVTTGVR